MSDDEEPVNPNAHKHLLQAISNLGKTQHIRKSTRSEPQRQQDEFQLIKADQSKTRHPVGVYDVVKVLKDTKKHLDAGKQLKNVQSSKKVLDRPLEKPAAERLKRSVGYEDVKQKLTRWDAAVAQNRSAETQVFPLSYETVHLDTREYSKPLHVSMKSKLRLELEKCDAELKRIQREIEGNFDDPEELAKREHELLLMQLTRDQLKSQRNDLTRIEILEAHRAAVARTRNKIKSKKYHKLLKRERTQEQIKEFELLQKTNPEAALEKLNALEKHRVLERASLRHKNTGAWAKNLQIRAKYDKDVRKDLAEQLQISRQLTEKKMDEDEESEQEYANEEAKEKSIQEAEALNDPFNPWIRAGTSKANKQENSAENSEGWRKYWLERNKNEKLMEEHRNMDVEKHEDIVEKGAKERKQTTGSSKSKQVKQKKSISNGKVKKIRASASKRNAKSKLKQLKKQTKALKKLNIENGWLVEEIEDVPKSKLADINIDDIFDEKEDEIKCKLNKKLKQLSKQAQLLNKVKERKKMATKAERDELQNLKDLSFKSTKQRPMIDEELNHDELQENAAQAQTNAAALTMPENASETKTNAKTAAANETSTTTIDPSKLATVKLKQHANNFTALNDGIDGDFDIDEALDEPNAAQQMTISQAFEDDDIIADFNRDKKKEEELKNTEIELTMPGWGAWAGAGISAEKQNAYKNKRLLLKLTKEEKRRDENKEGVYISEAASKHLREHLVSDVPFPFTSVADYEASIRAPIGRNFVPETAFRMLTRPAVITKKGKIIEPMDENELVKPERRLRHVVDRRIAKAKEEQKEIEQAEQNAKSK